MSDTGLRIFLDRSVGTRTIAAALRALSLDVQTIQDRYGDESSTVVDVRWIEDATKDDRILIGADQRIRYNPLERHAICRHAARCFTFPRGQLTGLQMVDRLTLHIEEVGRIANEPGPYVYHLNAERVSRMKLDCDDVADINESIQLSTTRPPGRTTDLLDALKASVARAHRNR